MAPKKKQPEKMSLGTFLGDQSLGSWADEMEDMPMPSSDSRTGYGGERRGFSSQASFGGDRDRDSMGGGYPRDALPFPSKPPYTAHLGNLSFDVTSSDISDFFADCAVTNVRIVEDKLDHKPKGFGYVEFGTPEGLKKALELSNAQFQGRNIRISVAEPPKDRDGGREISDWTRKGPLPELSGNTRRTSDRAPFRPFEGAGSEAGGDRGARRPPPFEQGDGKARDFGNWERKGPMSPQTSAPPTRDGGRMREGPDRGERTFERRQSPAWGEGQSRGNDARGEGRSQEGSRPPRPVVDRVPTAAETDTQWRTKMKPDAPTPVSQTPEPSAPSSPAPSQPPAPLVRQRLNLAKRTVSEAPVEDATTPTSDSKASPFGAARPIDTAARDAELAEKRTAAREKAAADSKARDEKKLADKAAAAAAKAEKGASPAPAHESRARHEPKEKENGATSPTAPGRQFEILRRMADADDGAPETDSVDDEANANGAIVDDKAVKPVETTRPIGSGEAEPTTGALESDGWTAVERPGRKGKTGNGGARALAS